MKIIKAVENMKSLEGFIVVDGTLIKFSGSTANLISSPYSEMRLNIDAYVDEFVQMKRN